VAAERGRHAGVDHDHAATEAGRDTPVLLDGVADHDPPNVEGLEDLGEPLRKSGLFLLGQAPVPQRPVGPRRQALQGIGTQGRHPGSDL